MAGELAPQAHDYIAAILESTARLGTLIDNVLDLTQSDAGGLPMERKPVDLPPLLANVVAELAAQMAAQAIDLAQDIDPKLGCMTGDARRLKGAVAQLMANAVAYTPQGGRILLHARGEEERVVIVISDNGPGMDEIDQARALDQFSRVGDDPRKSPERALGIGLPLAKHYVEAHGGTLTLISELGAGTAVQIELPRR